MLMETKFGSDLLVALLKIISMVFNKPLMGDIFWGHIHTPASLVTKPVSITGVLITGLSNWTAMVTRFGKNSSGDLMGIISKAYNKPLIMVISWVDIRIPVYPATRVAPITVRVITGSLNWIAMETQFGSSLSAVPVTN